MRLERGDNFAFKVQAGNFRRFKTENNIRGKWVAGSCHLSFVIHLCSYNWAFFVIRKRGNNRLSSTCEGFLPCILHLKHVCASGIRSDFNAPDPLVMRQLLRHISNAWSLNEVCRCTLEYKNKRSESSPASWTFWILTTLSRQLIHCSLSLFLSDASILAVRWEYFREAYSNF